MRGSLGPIGRGGRARIPGRQGVGCRGRVALAAAGLVLAALLPTGALAGVRTPSTNPLWLRDRYRTLAGVDLLHSTALLDPAAGSVRLPYAPTQLALDPAGGYALLATEAGVDAFVREGASVVPIPGWRLGGLPATGVSWLADGRAFAVSTTGALGIYGLDGTEGEHQAIRLAQVPVAGVLALAPGPADLPMAVLAAGTGGATLWAVQGTQLVPLGGGPHGLVGNLGVAATPDGRLVATWQAEAVELWVWDGSRYLPAPEWDPPPPALARGPIAAVLPFSRGGGYVILTRDGSLSVYALGVYGLQALPALAGSVAATPDPPITAAAGWGQDGVAVVYPTGWTFVSLRTRAPDQTRSLGGQHWAVYQARAVLQGLPVLVDHAVREIRAEDADCAADQTLGECSHRPVLPVGTSVQYALSAHGCGAWVRARPFENIVLAPGSAVCYRLRLATSDPTRSPEVSVTNLYEVAERLGARGLQSWLCLPATCGIAQVGVRRSPDYPSTSPGR